MGWLYIFRVVMDMQMGVVSIILAVIFLSSSMPGTCLCKIQNIRGISSKTRMKFIEGKKLNKRFLEMVQVTVPIFLFWWILENVAVMAQKPWFCLIKKKMTKIHVFWPYLFNFSDFIGLFHFLTFHYSWKVMNSGSP